MGDPAAFDFRDRAVYLPESETLVLADLHVGRDRQSNVELPLGERADLRERLETLVGWCSPAEVVVAGDVLHSFSTVSYGVAASLGELVDLVEDAGAGFVAVAGNHDAQLASAYDGEIHDEYALADGTVVCHGHERPEAVADRYVIGHDHPAIEIEGVRRPCALFSADAHRGAAVLALPAFNRLAAGVVVNGATGRDFQSPLLDDVRSFHPVVYDADGDEELRFPPLGDLRSHL